MHCFQYPRKKQHTEQWNVQHKLVLFKQCENVKPAKQENNKITLLTTHYYGSNTYQLAKPEFLVQHPMSKYKSVNLCGVAQKQLNWTPFADAIRKI